MFPSTFLGSAARPVGTTVELAAQSTHTQKNQTVPSRARGQRSRLAQIRFRQLVQLATVVLFGLAVAVIVLADIGWRGPFEVVIGQLPGKDKTVHFFLYGGLVVPLFLSMGIQGRRLVPGRLLRAALIMFGLATVEEFSQIFLSSRCFDWRDLGCNLLGIAFFSVLTLLILQKLRRTINRRLLGMRQARQLRRVNLFSKRYSAQS